MIPLLTVDPQSIMSGLYTGAKKTVQPLWDEGNNIAFKELGVQKLRGAALEATISGPPPVEIAQAYVNGVQRLWASDGDYWRVLDKTGLTWAQNLIYNFPTAGTYVDIETWGAWALATNGIDQLALRKAGNALPITAPFTTAQVLKRKGVFMLAANTSQGEANINHSGESDVEEWTVGTKRSGVNTIRDLDSGIIAIEDIGDRLAIYSRNRLSIGTFVGGASVFGYRTMVEGIGAVSRRSVVRVDPYNYGLCETGVFRTDGMSFQYLDEPAMRAWLKANVDWSRRTKIWGFHDVERHCVTWHFQNNVAAWLSITYHYQHGVFTKGNMQLFAGASADVLGAPLVVGESGKIGGWQTEENLFGIAFDANIKSRPLDFGDKGRFKTLNLVLVDGEWHSPSTRLKVQALQHPTDPAPVICYDQPLARENYFQFEAPFFTIEFSGNRNWHINGFSVLGTVGGFAI